MSRRWARRSRLSSTATGIRLCCVATSSIGWAACSVNTTRRGFLPCKRDDRCPLSRKGARAMSTLLRFVFLAAAFWLTATASAFAQDAPDITLKFSPADLEVLSKALHALPISETADTITKIQAQIDAQPGPQWAKYRSATTVQD